MLSLSSFLHRVLTSLTSKSKLLSPYDLQPSDSIETARLVLDDAGRLGFLALYTWYCTDFQLKGDYSPSKIVVQPHKFAPRFLPCKTHECLFPQNFDFFTLRWMTFAVVSFQTMFSSVLKMQMVFDLRRSRFPVGNRILLPLYFGIVSPGDADKYDLDKPWLDQFKFAGPRPPQHSGTQSMS